MADNLVEYLDSSCPLCTTAGGQLVFDCDKFRVVWADEPLYPGFLRLIWKAHVREFSNLTEADQLLCMRSVALLERFVLQEMKADKANLATLGNVVPHLHWHVIPRFKKDSHFPAPIWAQPLHNGGLCVEQVLIQKNMPELQANLLLLLNSLCSST